RPKDSATPLRRLVEVRISPPAGAGAVLVIFGLTAMFLFAFSFRQFVGLLTFNVAKATAFLRIVNLHGITSVRKRDNRDGRSAVPLAQEQHASSYQEDDDAWGNF